MNIILPTSDQLFDLRIRRADALRRGATKAVVAGGCLRDILLCRRVSDVDVFHEGALTNLEGLVDLPSVEVEAEYRRAVRILVDNSYQVPVQYIQVKDLALRLATFSTPLSEVYLDDSGLVLTEGFLESVDKKKIIFRVWASPAYQAKIMEKYPEFAVIGGWLS